jgi:translation initiation factor IF-3
MLFVCAGSRLAFFILFWRCFTIASKELRINEKITAKEVRLIGNDGQQHGIMSASAALEIAYDAGYDLVDISPTAVPPVCKVMDYGKYRFESDKREKEQKNKKIFQKVLDKSVPGCYYS